ERVLQAAGVPCARLRSLPVALASEHVQARGFVQELEDGTQVPTLPCRLGNARSYPPASKAPKIGEHSDAIRQRLAQAHGGS
ncbi:MAG: CoA transferase, partial [Pseudomonadota bacterium]